MLIPTVANGFTSEASELGWRPGEWPNRFHSSLNSDGFVSPIEWVRTAFVYEPGTQDIAYAIYRAGNLRLTVWND